jgi:hypothetical protein
MVFIYPVSKNRPFRNAFLFFSPLKLRGPDYRHENLWDEHEWEAGVSVDLRSDGAEQHEIIFSGFPEPHDGQDIES